MFTLVVVALLALSMWLLNWTIRQNIEEELGEKLIAVGHAVTVTYDVSEWSILFQGGGARTRARFQNRLSQLRDRTQVKRIFVFDLNNRIFVDTDQPDGSVNTHVSLRLFDSEIRQVRAGLPTHSILFDGPDGEPAMMGFVPIQTGSEIIGGIGVSGSATFLRSLRRLQSRLIWLGLLCIGSTIAAAVALARTITRPIDHLAHFSGQIAVGDYSRPIPQCGRDELGDLARTMETMRLNIRERENEQKAMIAGVAHEIRNPLGGMELFAGLLQDEAKPGSTQAEQVAHITREIGHLKTIVTRFLDFARPQHPNPEQVQIRAAVESCLHLIQESLQKNRILVQNHITMEERVWIDPNHFREILLNLLQNAVQSMPESGLIEISSMHERSFWIKIRIRDTGPGIPESKIADIFKPFYTTRTEGTGLGLSISRSLTEANGGRLTLESGSEGTVFEIQLKSESARDFSAVENQSI